MTVDTVVEINVLGCRDLKPSMSFLPINKAFIVFDLSSMQTEGVKLRNVQTNPLDYGPNPTINTMIKFDCKMPVDPLFCPSMSVLPTQCSVYDYLFLGLSKPLIGTFTINLGELFHSKQQHPLETATVEPGKVEVQMESTVYDQMKKLPEHSSAIGVTSRPAAAMTAELSLTEARLGGFVKKPQYAENATTGKLEEVQVPDPNYYMQVGYDRSPGEGSMHYRYVIKGELEKSVYIDECPFQTFDIVRGQALGSDSYFDLFTAQKVKTVGEFKGLVRIYRPDFKRERDLRMQKLKERKEQMKQKIGEKGNMLRAMAEFMGGKEKEEDVDDLQFEEISKMIMSKTNVIARVYILDAFGVAQKDENSQSDPYLVLKLGDTKISEEKSYQTDTSEPKFFKMYELSTILPGASILKIQVWDHDDVFSDDKIGETHIDLEDRFFSMKWRKLQQMPIETRPLYLKTSRVPQGAIRLWLEILQSSDRAGATDWDITPRPPAEFEARLIVWQTAEVANMDVEGTSDLYVRAWVNECAPKETDTHYRCQNGKGSFNWRFVFPLKLPCDNCVANLQIWDRDMLSFNDFIADTNFSFNVLAKKAWENGSRVKRVATDDAWMRSKKEDEKFWVQCMKKKKEGGLEPGGKLQVSFELVPVEQAKACPVGEGRNEPNTDPYLPPPVGRFEWSWNPCKLLKQTVGPEVRCKLCCAFCCILCIVICIFFGPLIATNLIGYAISTAAEA